MYFSTFAGNSVCHRRRGKEEGGKLFRSFYRSLSYKSGFAVTQDLGKYLGVPLLHQCITKQTYGYIIETLHQKLATWKSKQMSLAGRITLCKSILATVPLYLMQSSLLPKSIYFEIEKIC